MGARTPRGTARTAQDEPYLRGRLPVLRRSATEVQVGTDPRWAVALADLTPEATRALVGVPAGAARRTVVSALRRAGATETEVLAVLAHLGSTHHLVPRAPGATADEAVWALLHADADGATVMTRRGRACVEVRGLGRTGTAVATTLAAAGVGTVVPVDDGTVSRHDVGVGGLRADDVGLGREAAVARLLREVAPDVRTGPPGRAGLVVLVEHHAADPVRYAALHDAGRPHLSVVVREASVLVGPLVRPGLTPCLRCVDLGRSRRDDRWPTLAAQLTRLPPLPEETTLAALGGSLAAAQALALVDGRPIAVGGASLVVTLPDAVPRMVAWDGDTACGCTGPAEGDDGR